MIYHTVDIGPECEVGMKRKGLGDIGIGAVDMMVFLFTLMKAILGCRWCNSSHSAERHEAKPESFEERRSSLIVRSMCLEVYQRVEAWVLQLPSHRHPQFTRWT